MICVCHEDKVCSETWCYHLLDTVYSCHSPQKHPYLTVCLNPALQCSRKCGGGSKYRKVRCQQLLSLGQMIDKAEVIIIIMITIILVPIKLIILVPTKNLTVVITRCYVLVSVRTMRSSVIWKLASTATIRRSKPTWTRTTCRPTLTSRWRSSSPSCLWWWGNCSSTKSGKKTLPGCEVGAH